MIERIITICGIEYKLGLHGKAFKKVDGDWMTTTTTPAQIRSAIKKADLKALELLNKGSIDGLE